jgi:conjugal transfer pilus assembly protein TraF
MVWNRQAVGTRPADDAGAAHDAATVTPVAGEDVTGDAFYCHERKLGTWFYCDRRKRPARSRRGAYAVRRRRSWRRSRSASTS